ncbi:MAG TPA: ferric reductase-like transmembrane domain-containing protein [Acidimicrobiales bacterium]|nr:ferric reductase-like transmembrane domain-containing protein [Acidimicrobiales bacterium]
MSPPTAVSAPALLAAANGRELWYLTRSTGIVALVLLTATVVMGIAANGEFTRPRWPRFVTQGLHRNLSLLAVVFVFLHVMTTVVDGYVPIGWLDAVVPFLSPYHRVWSGLGAIAVDLLLAVVLSSALRRHIGHRTWRVVHLLSYAAWPVALVHGLGAGTDTATLVMRWIAALSIVAVGTAATWRLTRRRPWKVAMRVLSVLALVTLSADAAATNTFASVVHAAPVLRQHAAAPGGGRPA